MIPSTNLVASVVNYKAGRIENQSLITDECKAFIEKISEKGYNPREAFALLLKAMKAFQVSIFEVIKGEGHEMTLLFMQHSAYT